MDTIPGEATLLETDCSPFVKLDNSKRNEFAPQGSKYFLLLELSHLRIKLGVLEGKQKDIKIVSFILNGGKSTQCIHSP